jgi:tagaturonate reductase
MAQLNYQVLKESGYNGYILEKGKEKVMQFGEGNFLRAFVDDFIDIANEKAGYNGKVVLVQPIAQGLTDLINQQEGLYTLYLRGSENGVKVDDKRVISAVSRCINPYGEWDKVLDFARSDDLEIIVSNTTEAGIVHDTESTFDQTPPVSFPAKLTRVLYERWTAGKPGIVMLSCELIDNNGKELLKCVNQYIDDWKLDDGFRKWVNEENIFCSTLVDRIVPGRIRDPEEVKRLAEENGYEDPLTDVGEVFGIWVIEGPEGLEDRLPFKKAGVPVIVVPDVTPYKKRKVRILNGAHTGFVPGAYLAGFDIVRDCMHSSVIRDFMNRMLEEEIIPVLPLPEEECREFAAAVQDRFDNPFVDHALLSITLNSTSKWRTRNLPSLLEYKARFDRLPPLLVMSLAMLIAFYSTGIRRREKDALICCRDMGGREQEYRVLDDAGVLDFYCARRDAEDAVLVREVLENRGMWGQDLTQVRGLESLVAEDLALIRTKGAFAAFEAAAKGAGDNGQRKV